MRKLVNSVLFSYVMVASCFAFAVEAKELELSDLKRKAFYLGNAGTGVRNTAHYLVVNKQIDFCYLELIRKNEEVNSYNTGSNIDLETITVPCEKYKKYKEVKDYFEQN